MNSTSVQDANYEINKAENGYIVTRAWKEILDDAKPFDYNYKSSKNIFNTWKDVVNHLSDNGL